MKVEIKDSVEQAGLKVPVENTSKLFSKVIPRVLQHLVRVTWEVMRDVYDARWLVVTIEYDGVIKEREVFEPASLADEAFMRERCEWLWRRVIRTSLLRSVEQPAGETGDPLVQVSDG